MYLSNTIKTRRADKINNVNAKSIKAEETLVSSLLINL